MTYESDPSSLEQSKSKVAQAVDASKATATSAVQTVSEHAQAARSKIAAGTEMLSEEARQRVISARQAALNAGRATKRTVRWGQRSAENFFENQPLVVGALAVAVGAAIGGLMPRSRFEDEHMGSHRDRLVSEADRILEEEKRKLGVVAEAAAGEARSILDAKRDAVDQITGDKTLAGTLVDEVKRVRGQIAITAADKAKTENLGKPKV
jgi:hypothetical protein